MTETEKLTFRDRWELLKKQRLPLVERSELVDAIREIPNLGPFDFNLAGVPSFLKSYVLLFFMGMYLTPLAAINVLYANGELFVPLELLGQLNLLGLAAVLVCISAGTWVAISMNKGAFGYKKVINYFWRYLDRRAPRQGEFRVNRFLQIWPLTDEEMAKLASEAEDYEKQMQEFLAEDVQMMALPGMTPELEERLKKDGFITLKQVSVSKVEELKKVKGIDDDLASILIGTARGILTSKDREEEEDTTSTSVDDESMALPSSSLYRIRKMLKQTPGLKKAPVPKDDVKEGLDLRHEFLRLVRDLHKREPTSLKLVYTLMMCAGNLNILVISRYPLSGGEDSEESSRNKVEFRDHTLTQRTYIWQDENQRATVAWFTQLAEFKFYTIPDEKSRALGKESSVMHCPIAYLNMSDGQAEDDDRNFLRARMTFKGSETLQAETVYNVSIAEKFMERDKILTSTLARVNTSIKDIWRQAKEWAKNTIAEAVNMIFLERKYRQPGRWGGIVNLFSSKAVKYFLIFLSLVMLYLLVAYIFGLPYNPLGDIDPGGTGGGAEVIP